MSVPDFLAHERDDDIPPSRTPAPKILDQRPDGQGYVLVTFALPGLKRHTVRVPVSSWLRGEHLAIGAQAHVTLDAMLPPMVPDDDAAPDDMPEHDG